MRSYSLKNFSFFLYAIIITSTLILILVSLYDTYLHVLQDLEKQVNTLSYNIETGIDNYYNYIESTMKNIATNISINNDLNYVNTIFESSSKTFNNDLIKLDNFIFIDAHNKGLVSSNVGILPKPIDYSNDIKFLMNNTYNVSKVNTCSKLYNSNINGQRSIAFSITVHDAQSKHLGTVLYDLSISDLFKYIKSFIKSEYAGFILSDYYGKNIIRYPLHKKIMSKHHCRNIQLFLTYNLLLCYDSNFIKINLLSRLPIEGIKIFIMLAAIIIIAYILHKKIFKPIVLLASNHKIAPSIIELQKLSIYIKKYNKVCDNLDSVQKQLIKKDMEAEIAQKTKLEFIACISHELRTPLNAIITFSEMIKKQAFGAIKTKKYVEYGNDIYEAGNRLLLMVDNILYISKIEAGMADLKREEIDIRNIIDAILEKFNSAIEDKRISVNREYSTHAPCLLTDKKKISLVISHVISNAIKFNNQDGSINIKVKYIESMRDNGLVISITDTGIGIDLQKIKYVFDDFNQASSTLKRQFQGIGLGLSITKKIIELYQGKIFISSTVDEWTKVTITFPRSVLILK